VNIRNRATKGAQLDGDPGGDDPPGRERNAGLTQADRPERAATEHVGREDPAGDLHGLLRGRPGGEQDPARPLPGQRIGGRRRPQRSLDVAPTMNELIREGTGRGVFWTDGL
jgi:hypothetical protein